MPKSKRRNNKKVVVEEEPEEYEVERVDDHRVVTMDDGQPQLQYYLKWKNYGPDSNTWEPEDSVSAEDLVEKYWSLNGGKEMYQQIMKEIGGETSRKRKSSKESNDAKASKRVKETNTSFYESESELDISENEIEDETFRPGVKNWKEVVKIEKVRPGEEDSQNLYAVVRWNDGKLSKHPTAFVAKRVPLMLIDYYEKRILFEKAD